MNTNHPEIDMIALLGKGAVDFTKWKPWIKFAIKLTIDEVAKCVKEQLDTYLLDMESIAQRYGLSRLIAIPCQLPNNVKIILFTARGGDVKGFFDKIGIQFIWQEFDPGILNEIERIEKNYGILIYQKQLKGAK